MRTMIYDNELFEECKNYPSYFCSRSGRLISIMYIGGNGREDMSNAHELSPSVDRDGYHQYVLKVNGRRLTKRAHRIIAEQFLPDYSEDLMVNHKNGIKNCNNVENLEMCTGKENTQHAWRTGLITQANCSNSTTINVGGTITYDCRSMKQANDFHNDLPMSYIKEIKDGTYRRYERMYFERLDPNGLIYCYNNGILIKTYTSNIEIAKEFGKASNTISYKVNNKLDLIYKIYHIEVN